VVVARCKPEIDAAEFEICLEAILAWCQCPCDSCIANLWDRSLRFRNDSVSYLPLQTAWIERRLPPPRTTLRREHIQYMLTPVPRRAQRKLVCRVGEQRESIEQLFYWGRHGEEAPRRCGLGSWRVIARDVLGRHGPSLGMVRAGAKTSGEGAEELALA
jgi:hypothetical protein